MLDVGPRLAAAVTLIVPALCACSQSLDPRMQPSAGAADPELAREVQAASAPVATGRPRIRETIVIGRDPSAYEPSGRERAPATQPAVAPPAPTYSYRPGWGYGGYYGVGGVPLYLAPQGAGVAPRGVPAGAPTTVGGDWPAPPDPSPPPLRTKPY